MFLSCLLVPLTGLRIPLKAHWAFYGMPARVDGTRMNADRAD
jgi:hypothetical protein